jgi:cytochrome c peroxidase
MLFYDKRLSKDGTQACASCHQQKDGFSDSRRFSIGVENLPGKRQAMPLFNLAWHKSGFFWDGRAATLREQSLRPIQDPLEMNETLDNVVKKVGASSVYSDQFIRAFGSDSVSSYRISLALEQFMFTIVSGNSKYDKYLRKEATLTPEEESGRKIFFTEFDPTGKVKGGECFHCHGGVNFTNDQYINNGLDDDASFTDAGRFTVTSNPRDRATFKVPSLRNIAFTSPYMHDGRMATLEEVVMHYNQGVKKSSTLEFLMQYNVQPGGLGLSAKDQADLVAFLKTLTDETYLNNSAYSAP